MKQQMLQVLGMSAMLLAAAAGAQSYPNKSVRIILPFAPGGGGDLTARLVAQKMNESLMQSVIVDNRPGADGVIGTDIVAKAAPDGYTVLLVTGGVHRPLVDPMAYAGIEDAHARRVVENNFVFVLAAGFLPSHDITKLGDHILGLESPALQKRIERFARRAVSEYLVAAR